MTAVGRPSRRAAAAHVALISALLAGCASAPPPAPVEAQPPPAPPVSRGRFLLTYEGGAPVMEIDTGGPAACQVFRAAALRSPSGVPPAYRVEPQVHCEPRSQRARLPVAAAMLDLAWQLEYPLRFRNHALCHRLLPLMTRAGNGMMLTRGCAGN